MCLLIRPLIQALAHISFVHSIITPSLNSAETIECSCSGSCQLPNPPPPPPPTHTHTHTHTFAQGARQENQLRIHLCGGKCPQINYLNLPPPSENAPPSELSLHVPHVVCSCVTKEEKCGPGCRYKNYSNSVIAVASALHGRKTP